MDKVSSFSFFSNDVGLKESPRAVPDPGTLLRVLSPDRIELELFTGDTSKDNHSPGHVLFCCFILIFPRFYLISFQIYLFVCLSVCLMVAMLMSISTFFE